MAKYDPSTSTVNTSAVPAAANVTAAQLPPFPDKLDLNDHRKPLHERLQAFRISWQAYAQAVGLYEWPAERQKAMLMSAIGPAGAKVYRELQSAHQQNTANNNGNNIEDDDDTAKGVDGKDVHRRSVSGRVLAIIIRHLLGGDIRLRRMAAAKQIRYDTELYMRFIDRLRVHIDACDYAERRDDVMLDRIIAGVNNLRLSEELCSMRELSLDSAITRCRLEDFEVLNNSSGAISKHSVPINKNTSDTAKTSNPSDGRAQQSPLAILQPTENVSTKAPNPFRKTSNPFKKTPIENHPATLTNIKEHAQKQRSPLTCFRCGDQRLGRQHMGKPHTCPSQGHMCTKCGRWNHYEWMCRN